jgi:hypothetical protein
MSALLKTLTLLSSFLSIDKNGAGPMPLWMEPIHSKYGKAVAEGRFIGVYHVSPTTFIRPVDEGFNIAVFILRLLLKLPEIFRPWARLWRPLLLRHLSSWKLSGFLPVIFTEGVHLSLNWSTGIAEALEDSTEQQQCFTLLVRDAPLKNCALIFD